MKWRDVFHDPSPWITALATIVIAIYTGVLAYVTRRQSKLTRESIDFARDEAKERTRAHVRPGFPSPPRREQVSWQIRTLAKNVGPAGCTFNGMVVRFSDNMPTRADFDSPAEGHDSRNTATILLPGDEFEYIRPTPTVTDGQYCYGYLRWEDAVGRWRYYFCMSVWSTGNSPPGHDNFHQTGGEGYNGEERSRE